MFSNDGSAGRSADISFLAKLIQREIIYRLLQEILAYAFARCHIGDQVPPDGEALTWLRSNYEKPLRVEHLATIAGMSRSTLHSIFAPLRR